MGKKGAERKPHQPRGTVAAAVHWMHEQGQTCQMAADRFGVTQQAVHHAWRRLYGDTPTPARELTAARRGEITALVADGATMPEMATRLELSHGTVRSICIQLNLTPVHALEKRRDQLRDAFERMTDATAAEIAAACNVDEALVRRQRPRLMGYMNPRSYVSRRDGRGQRAASLVEGGMRMRDACIAERVGRSSVTHALKMRKATRKRR